LFSSIWLSKAAGIRMSALICHSCLSGIDSAPGKPAGSLCSSTVARSQQLRALLAEQFGRPASGVAEALNDERGLAEIEVLAFRPGLEGVDRALRGGLVASERATGRQRLARDHTAHRKPIVCGGGVDVGVHHPHHGLSIGAHVGRGDVVVGPDVLAERMGEAAGDPHQLDVAVLLWINLDAALCATKRYVDERALERHPAGERLHFIDVD